MQQESIHQFLVIGGGVAGCAAAHYLCEAGHDVQLVEAGPRLGGRLFSKRLSVTCGADLSFDIGGQFMRFMDPQIMHLAQDACRAGALEPMADIMRLKGGAWLDGDGALRYRGRPHMASFADWLARDCAVKAACAIDELTFDDTQQVWTARSSASHFSARAVVLAVPPQRAAALHPPFMEALADVSFSACWSLSVAFNSPVPMRANAAMVDDDVIGWIARQPNNRDGERFGRDRIVVHANADWSDAMRSATPEKVTNILLERLAGALGAALPGIGFSEAVLWPSAKVSAPLGKPCLLDNQLPIAAIGDWCTAPRIEAAILSARAAVQMLAARL